KDFLEFRRLIGDISVILGPSPTAPVTQAEKRSKLEDAKGNGNRNNQGLIERKVKSPWRTYGPLALALAVGLTVFSVAFWWLVVDRREENKESVPVDTPQTAGISRGIDASTSETISAVIYSHQLGFTRQDAETLQRVLDDNGIPSRVLIHRDPNPPDAVF